MTEYSMYGAVPLRTIKQALLDLKAEGTLDRAEDGDAHQLHVRRPRLQHAPRDGRVPGDQARPDLPVGRGVVRLRALVAVPAPAHRHGRRGRDCEEWRASPAALEALQGAGRRARRGPRPEGQAAARRGAWFPTRARCASASTRPTRCTSRCRRCARDRSSWSRDEDYNHHVVGVPRGGLHPRLDLAQRADHRVARRRAPPDGAGGLRARDAARSRSRSRSAGQSTRTRSSRSTSACSAPTG